MTQAPFARATRTPAPGLDPSLRSRMTRGISASLIARLIEAYCDSPPLPAPHLVRPPLIPVAVRLAEKRPPRRRHGLGRALSLVEDQHLRPIGRCDRCGVVVRHDLPVEVDRQIRRHAPPFYARPHHRIRHLAPDRLRQRLHLTAALFGVAVAVHDYGLKQDR